MDLGPLPFYSSQRDDDVQARHLLHARHAADAEAIQLTPSTRQCRLAEYGGRPAIAEYLRANGG
jgi:hypothetical protein